MNLKNLKFDLPKTWREASRTGNDNQVVIHIYHISPLAHVDKKIFQDQPISSNSTSSVSKIAVPVPSGVGGSMAEFFKGTQALISGGYMPSYMTTSWLNDLKNKMTKTPGAEIPDESDITADVSIVQYQTKDMAKQMFKNYGVFPTGGFGVLTMGVDLPGKPNATYMDLLESDVFKNVVSKEQIAKMKEMSALIKKETPKLKEQIAKTGMKYKEEKYLGYDAIFSEFPNPTPAPKAVPVKKNTGGMGGGYGNNMFTPLPKISKPYQKTIKFCQAILINNFVITGSALSLPFFMPAGNTPCYSLTKTEQRKETVEGIKSTYFVPSASNYASEGYFCKEDAEKMLKVILTKLSGIL
jgi:hypothetical protein